MSDTAIKVGFGAADLTPPPGLEMSGFSARTEPATGTHDPLFTRVIYFEEPDGPESSLLLITFDLIGMSQKLVNAIKERVQAQFGIPAARRKFRRWPERKSSSTFQLRRITPAKAKPANECWRRAPKTTPLRWLMSI